MAVAALLAAVAIPSYMTSVRKNNRTDAYAALARVAAAQEMFFNNQPAPRAYSDDFNVLAVPNISENRHYDLSVTACPGRTLTDCYVAVATARADSSQAKDTGCTTLTLDSRGQRGSAPEASGCWRK